MASRKSKPVALWTFQSKPDRKNLKIIICNVMTGVAKLTAGLMPTTQRL